MRRLDRVDMALFEGLEGEALEEVYWRLVPRRFDAGRVICRAGEPGESLLVLRRGLVHALADEPRGANPEPTVLARYRPGDVIGEMALLTAEPHAATLVARLPTDALELRRETFLSLATRFPALLANLARILSRRLVAQAGTARPGRRAEAIMVVTGRRGLAYVDDLLVATRAASPRPVDAISLTTGRANAQRTAEALARIEASLRDGGTVVTVAGSDHGDLPLLLDYMDRVIAIMDSDEARGLADRLGTLAERIELVELEEHGRPAAGWSPERVVRRRSRQLQKADLAWLGRHLARTKLGLALGAGGAKGYAHVGVIRVLQRAGYTIDYVAGASIGAWVGAWLALGMDADAIEQTLRREFTTEVAEAVFRRGAAGEPSGLEVMAELARRTTDGRTFEQLEIPLVVLTADLQARLPAPITTGPLHEALPVAMAVPGLYPPIQRGSQRLVDAVVTTPVPTEAATASGADVTLAVNLLGRETRPVWPGDDPLAVPVRPAGTRDGVVEALEVAQMDASARQTALADVPITPRFGPGTWRHFHLADRYLAAGAEAAEAMLPALAALARPQALG
jgi:NTE family protein